MGLSLGIIFAFIAMIGWGFGDFFIQKSTRKVGDWETLFLITFFGAVVLTPFVYKDIPGLLLSNPKIWVLLIGSAVLFLAALLDFEALKEGKLDVVEPIWSLEIPVSAFLAFFLIKEGIGLTQIILIALLMSALVLVSLRSRPLSGRVILEKGALIAVVAAILMGTANFLIGVGSRVSGPLLMNWFLNVFIAVLSFIFIFVDSDLKKMFRHYKKEKKIWWGMCIFDNAAWIAFASAMVLAPIAITVALSDSYIIIAVLLGAYVNKE